MILKEAMNNKTKARKKGKLVKDIIKNKYNYLFFLPAAAIIIVFHYIPMYGITIAFKDFMIRKGILGSPWIGLYHFQRLFESGKFWQVLNNTIIISLLKLVFGFPAPVLFAIFINEIRNMKFKKAVQTISYLPHFLSWVVVAGMLMDLLSPSHGVINYIIQLLGGTPIYFMAEPDYFRSILVVTDIWKEVGWATIIYLAAIAGIEQDQYDSAFMDGANRFQVMRHITLPSILSVVTIVFILRLGKLLNAGFDQVFNLYNDAVRTTGDIIDTFVYRQGILDMNYSYSTAVSLFKNIIGLVLVLGSNLVIRKISHGENGLW
jgi:putative aldouronate transport system permease protein